MSSGSSLRPICWLPSIASSTDAHDGVEDVTEVRKAFVEASGEITLIERDAH